MIRYRCERNGPFQLSQSQLRHSQSHCVTLAALRHRAALLPAWLAGSQKNVGMLMESRYLLVRSDRSCIHFARNSLLYSNRRTIVPDSLFASGCNGLIRTAGSSGTMTEGTSRSAEDMPRNQFAPACTLTRPAGMAAQEAGSLETSIISLAAQTSFGTSICTKYRFRGKPESSMCAAVSRTAIAILGAA